MTNAKFTKMQNGIKVAWLYAGYHTLGFTNILNSIFIREGIILQFTIHKDQICNTID